MIELNNTFVIMLPFYSTNCDYITKLIYSTMNFSGIKYLVVGSGFFGATIAERIANDMKQPVMIVEARNHIGGNCYSEVDFNTEIEVHKYGSHIFHTNDAKVWEYINRFSHFNNYRHKVLTKFKDQLFFMPINLDTINRFYRKDMSPSEAHLFLSQEAARTGLLSPKNFEEKAISQIGRPLYEAFIKGYTNKQWGISPTELPESTIDRLPVRTNYDVNYFDDQFQGIPLLGYRKLFENMLNNPLIDLKLKTDFFHLRETIPASVEIIYSGPVDRLCDFRFGQLSWRGLDFESEIHESRDLQGTAVVNYAAESIPYTRIHEFKHYHPERRYRKNKTIIFKEYPKSTSSMQNPFYPVNTFEDKKKIAKYLDYIDNKTDMTVGGRLGTYKYYDMDKVIKEALHLYNDRIKRRTT